jgi:tRNA (guanine10-N2)-methyltransferase
MTCSFKFVVSAFGSTINAKDQLKIINSFSYLGFQGPIDMKNPDVQFHVLADHGTENAYTNKPTQTEPHYIYMGKLASVMTHTLMTMSNVFLRLLLVVESLSTSTI